jgi:SSS family solute:Na+ symporter
MQASVAIPFIPLLLARGVGANGSVGDIAGIAPLDTVVIVIYLLVYCVIIQVSLTLLNGTPVPLESKALCWNSPLEPLRAASWPGLGNYKVLSLALFGTMTVLYWIFR